MIESKAKKDRGDTDGLLDEAKAMGIPAARIQEYIDAQGEEDDDNPIEVWPESIPAIELWGQVGYMWMFAPLGGRLHLNWDSVKARIELMERAHDPETGEPIVITSDAIEGVAELERAILRYQDLD